MPYGPDDRGERIRKALESLKYELDAYIVLLRFYEGLSLSDIAKRLSIDYDLVRARYRSAMAELERILGNAISPAPTVRRRRFDPHLEERIETIAELFWEALHNGEDPDREAYFQQYAELGEPLRGRLSLMQLVYRERPRDGRTLPLAEEESARPVEVWQPVAWREKGEGMIGMLRAWRLG
ncbi:MAG: sigma factor-like helix-turn-helix DNA-binding protein [Planctomycetota bacterium]|nr:sigma factor-like helix-turn-helix DNA-binding protein [Planctomycetota bacterium]